MGHDENKGFRCDRMPYDLADRVMGRVILHLRGEVNMEESERQGRIDAFYSMHPRDVACDNCVRQISIEQMERSTEETGYRLCGFCLAVELARRRRSGFSIQKISPLCEEE